MNVKKKHPLKSVKIAFESSMLGVTTLGCYQNSQLLFLHGAGQSNQNLFMPLREDLYQLGFSSLAFDFIGHGETGGLLETSSLEQRFNQACSVIENFSMSQPLSIIAASMSGYIALKLLKKYRIKNIILFVPAVYDTKAYSVPFNQGFTEIIREPESWLNSDAWDIIQNFNGNLLLLAAQYDQVVPFSIIQKLYTSAVHAKKSEIFIVKDCPHQILRYLSENASKRDEVVKKILNILEAF